MSDENEYLTLSDDKKTATGTVTFRLRLDELSADTPEGVRRRKALRLIADALNGGVDVETLDGSEMGVIGVYDHVPPHCTECGVLMGADEIGDEFPEERNHEVCPNAKPPTIKLSLDPGVAEALGTVLNDLVPDNGKRHPWMKSLAASIRRKAGKAAKKPAPET